MTTITSLTDVRAARRGERDTATLVAAAAEGEAQAWRELIDRYTVLVRCVCRSHRLTDADADDVAQLTWLRAMKEITEFDCLAGDLSEQVLAHLRQHLPDAATAADNQS